MLAGILAGEPLEHLTAGKYGSRKRNLAVKAEAHSGAVLPSLSSQALGAS